MNDEHAERLRLQELVRKADAEWQTRAARSGFLRRFEREVDPGKALGEGERRERAVDARRRYMRVLAAKSAAVRRERAARPGGGSAIRARRPSADIAVRRRAVRRVGQDGVMRSRRRLSPKLVGRWRITEMDLWDQDAVELMGPGILELNDDGTGRMRFIAVDAELDHRPADRDGQAAIEFSWDGDDDGTPVNGRGWIALAG